MNIFFLEMVFHYMEHLYEAAILSMYRYCEKF